MQEIYPYEIVLSLAGHDQGQIFLVVGVEEDGTCLLADGRERKLDAPKRKNPKHLRGVGTSAHPAILGLHRGGKLTDRALRAALAVFRESSPI